MATLAFLKYAWNHTGWNPGPTEATGSFAIGFSEGQDFTHRTYGLKSLTHFHWFQRALDQGAESHHTTYARLKSHMRPIFNSLMAAQTFMGAEKRGEFHPPLIMEWTSTAYMDWNSPSRLKRIMKATTRHIPLPHCKIVGTTGCGLIEG